ncbi:hypothetical protein X975_23281, partial [Stegodyphus mimosarum]
MLRIETSINKKTPSVFILYPLPIHQTLKASSLILQQI